MTIARRRVEGRPLGVLFRAFFAQLFVSESATSDVQLRQTMVWVLAFVLTPCLLLLFSVFPQFQYLVIRVGRIHPPPGVITRATAVRNLMAEDMLEWAVAMLVGYSMVTIGLIAVFVWDALSFDRRDAMVLGPLPLRGSTIILAKLGALTALLLGAALSVNLFNAVVFAFETSDQFGVTALIAHFVACLVVTTAAATLVFATIVSIRSTVAIVGGPRLAAAVGSLLQFLFVVILFGFLTALTGAPGGRGRLNLPNLGTQMTPLTWFVAWFEVLRLSDRGSWSEVIAISHFAVRALLLTVSAAALTSVLAFRRQTQLALAPSAAPGPLGHARVSRATASALVACRPLARATADFILTTIARNRPQQAPIAINAALGFAMLVFGLVRARNDADQIVRAAPLILSYWTLIGLRASFFVPSELPASWMFQLNAPARVAQYRAAVRACLLALVAPAATLLAAIVGGPLHAVHVLLLVTALAELLMMTIDFIPFTRPYVHGHAKLKTRWPIYLGGAYVFSYGLPRLSWWWPIAAIALLEVVSRRSGRGWTPQPSDEDGADGFTSVTALNLTNA
jgi:hypothetical protein